MILISNRGILDASIIKHSNTTIEQSKSIKMKLSDVKKILILTLMLKEMMKF